MPKGHKKGAHLIRWTNDETLRVASAAANIRLEQQCGELEAWRQGQLVLPMERRRNISTASVVSPAGRELYRQQLRIQQQQPKPPEPQVNNEEYEPEQLPSIAEQHEHGELLERREPRVVDELLEELAIAVALKFVGAFKRTIIEQLRADWPDITDAARGGPYAAVEEKKRVEPKIERPPILVVGLLPAQADNIRQRFQDKLDLRFVSSQEPPQMINTRLGHAKKILLMTQFVSHSHQNTALQLRSREDVVLVPGSVSSLTRELERLNS